MSESEPNSDFHQEFYCPECRSRLTDDLIPSLLQKMPVYCENCGTLYPIPVIPIQKPIETKLISQKSTINFLGIQNVINQFINRLKTAISRLRMRLKKLIEQFKNSEYIKNRFFLSNWILSFEEWQNMTIKRKNSRRQMRLQQKLQRKIRREQLKLEKNEKKIAHAQAVAMFYQTNRQTHNNSFSDNSMKVNPPNAPLSVFSSFDSLHIDSNPDQILSAHQTPEFPQFSPVIISPVTNISKNSLQISSPLSPISPIKTNSMVEPDLREKRFDPMTGEPIAQPRIFTVLTPHQRDSLIQLPISDEMRQDLTSICLYLSSDQIDHYLDLLNHVNFENNADIYPYVNKILAMNIPNEQKKGLINQLEFLHARNRESFLLELEIAQTRDLMQQKANSDAEKVKHTKILEKNP